MAKSKATRLIGIDFGLARIGMSVSDERKIIAMPLTIVSASKKMDETIGSVARFLEEHQGRENYSLEKIIIGLPLMMSGKKGLLADETQHFGKLLEAKTGIPVVFWDERLTTVQAERSLMESSLTRKRRSKIVDSVAAVIILQNYLDFLSIQQESELR